MVDPAEAERRAEELRNRWVRYRRIRTAGWVLLSLGALVLAVHLFDHWEMLHLFDEQLEEVAIGFPTAGVLALVGVVCLGQLSPRERT